MKKEDKKNKTGLKILFTVLAMGALALSVHQCSKMDFKIDLPKWDFSKGFRLNR